MKNTKEADPEAYAIDLLEEEAAEIIQAICKIRRFGLDNKAEFGSMSNRLHLEREAGDILAAVSYACIKGLLNAAAVNKQKEEKLKKLLTFVCRDGSRLAP